MVVSNSYQSQVTCLSKKFLSKYLNFSKRINNVRDEHKMLKQTSLNEIKILFSFSAIGFLALRG